MSPKEFLNEKEYAEILSNICQTFQCNKDQVELLDNLYGGTNLVFSFNFLEKKYVYRHPSPFSNGLVSRGRESLMQSFAEACEIDPTLINMNVNEGWKISKYMESSPLNYGSGADIKSAISVMQKLHKYKTAAKWHFNVFDLVMNLKPRFDIQKCVEEYGLSNESIRISKLYTLTAKDTIPYCNCHGDCIGTNFLFKKGHDPILTDWEFAGYADPGFDIGSFISGGVFNDDDIDMIIRTYLSHEPNKFELRHYYAFIAITSFAFFLLSEYYIYNGQGNEAFRKLHPSRLRYMKHYSSKALTLYQ